jgi:hypothetical protein
MKPTLALAAGLVFAGGMAMVGPASAQDTAAGQTENAQTPTSEDFAAEFNRRFRYDDQAPADTAHLQRRPYDPYHDDEDESGHDQAADSQSPLDDEHNQRETSGQQIAEPERGEREDDRESHADANDTPARAPAETTGETSRERAPSRRACGARTERRIGRMLDRMERLTQPTGDQQQAFEKLRDAANKAIEIARTACPTERPITPGGRLAVAEKRLETLLEAIRTVRPALDDFYKTLSEEQKAHFYAARRWRNPHRQGDARDSLGNGRLDAWRDEMRRRWRERWSDDGRRFRDDGPYHHRYHDDRRWRRGDGWREDGGRERWRSERRDDGRRSRSHDDEDEDDPVESWSL